MIQNKLHLLMGRWLHLLQREWGVRRAIIFDFFDVSSSSVALLRVSAVVVVSPAIHEGHVKLGRPADPAVEDTSALGAHGRFARALPLEAVLLQRPRQSNLVSAVFFPHALGDGLAAEALVVGVRVARKLVVEWRRRVVPGYVRRRIGVVCGCKFGGVKGGSGRTGAGRLDHLWRR